MQSDTRASASACPGDDRQWLFYRAFDFRHARRNRQLKHIRTKPYTSKTNGKAERFIRALQRRQAPC